LKSVMSEPRRFLVLRQKLGRRAALIEDTRRGPLTAGDVRRRVRKILRILVTDQPRSWSVALSWAHDSKAADDRGATRHDPGAASTMPVA
jgi:hypothetical protein